MKIPDFPWPKTLMLVIAVLALILISIKIASAAGTSATITWIHPTNYTDGSALPLSDIKETIITWRRPGSAIASGSVRVTAPATSTVVTGLVCGSFNFTGATVVQTNDQSADATPVAYATGVRCLPNPPTGLGAT